MQHMPRSLLFSIIPIRSFKICVNFASPIHKTNSSNFLWQLTGFYFYVMSLTVMRTVMKTSITSSQMLSFPSSVLPIPLHSLSRKNITTMHSTILSELETSGDPPIHTVCATGKKCTGWRQKLCLLANFSMERLKSSRVIPLSLFSSVRIPAAHCLFVWPLFFQKSAPTTRLLMQPIIR